LEAQKGQALRLDGKPTVHGDARRPNIMINAAGESVQAMFIDFGWAGIAGQSRCVASCSNIVLLAVRLSGAETDSSATVLFWTLPYSCAGRFILMAHLDMPHHASSSLTFAFAGTRPC